MSQQIWVASFSIHISLWFDISNYNYTQDQGVRSLTGFGPVYRIRLSCQTEVLTFIEKAYNNLCVFCWIVQFGLFSFPNHLSLISNQLILCLLVCFVQNSWWRNGFSSSKFFSTIFLFFYAVLPLEKVKQNVPRVANFSELSQLFWENFKIRVVSAISMVSSYFMWKKFEPIFFLANKTWSRQNAVVTNELFFIWN